MARYSKNFSGTGYNATANIDSELSEIESTQADMLSRKAGDTPNSMETQLDMNSNKMINLAEGTASSDAATYGQLIDRSAYGAAAFKEYDTIAAAQADATLVVGDTFIAKDRGNSVWSVITTTTNNGRDFVEGTASSTTFELNKGREWNIVEFGAKSTNTDAVNKAILDAMIQDLDAAGGGIITIPGEIDYGFKLATPSTFPDLSSLTNGDISIRDDGQPNNESSGRAGAQTRTFFGTVPTTPAGQHNGNGFQIFGKWHPYYMVTNYETEETSGLSPYRASYFARGINATADSISPEGQVEFWAWGQRNATSANTNFADRTGFKIYTSSYIWDTGTTSWLNPDATVYAVDRYSGCQSFNSGVDRGVAYQFYLPEGIHSNICSFKGETSSELPEFKLEAVGTTNNYRLRPDATNADYQLSIGGTVRTSYDVNGNVHIGDALLTTSISEVAVTGLSQGDEFFRFIGDTFQASARYFAVSNAGSNGNASAIRVGTNSVTSRSINAGGTINASGADYAEYEENNNKVFEKGDILGFDEEGKLTDRFVDSVRFGIKSTNPSYVGGDTWGCDAAIGVEPTPPMYPGEDVLPRDQWESTELEQFKQDFAKWEERLEEARRKVDRIAYSGKVPVNITNGEPGDYLIAKESASGNIEGMCVKSPSFEQYLLSVGRVNKILPDGRLEVAVIVH